MRFLTAAAMLAAVLLARSSAHAAVDQDDPLPTGRIVVERCHEQPMSLALQIADAEAARSLGARSLSSLDEPVNATPAPRQFVAARAVVPTKPFTPTPQACTSPGEPGCEVSLPFEAPSHVGIAHIAHDGAVCVSFPEIAPPDSTLVRPAFGHDAAPTDVHRPSPWRPPTR